MAFHALPDSVAQEALDAWAKHGKSRMRAAMEIGIPIGTLEKRIETAQMRGLTPNKPVTIEALVEGYTATPAPDLSPRVPPKYRKIGGEGMVRIMAIGDAHDDPRIPDKSRFALMGAHAAATRPDVILSIGDFFDLASLSTHEREDTYKARGKPLFLQDVESGIKALDTLNAQLPADYKPRKHMTLGNHEYRAYRAEDSDPKALGMYVGALENMLSSAGWTFQQYGHWTVIGGVMFTHAPMSIMGKPLGGKNVENTVANDSKYSIVFGHTHRFNVVRRAKQGYSESVTVVNLGCAMPEAYVPSYATALPTGYTYGVVDMIVDGGVILSANLRSFRELEKIYG